MYYQQSSLVSFVATSLLTNRKHFCPHYLLEASGFKDSWVHAPILTRCVLLGRTLWSLHLYSSLFNNTGGNGKIPVKAVWATVGDHTCNYDLAQGLAIVKCSISGSIYNWKKIYSSIRVDLLHYSRPSISLETLSTNIPNWKPPIKGHSSFKGPEKALTSSRESSWVAK